MVISLATIGLQAGLSGIGAAGKTAADGTSGGSFNSNVQSNGGYMKSFWGGSGGTGGISNFSGPGSYYNKITSKQGLAAGGYVQGGPNIDSVSAMLNGGEFVLNRAATERIGPENLQNLNAGAESENSEKVVDKLNEILQATKDNNGEINITVNGGGGGESSSPSGGDSSGGGSSTVDNKGASNDTKYREELAKTIKAKILEVLREEKRLGGTLR